MRSAIATSLATLLAALAGSPATAQTLAGQTWIVGLPCDQVSVQTVIDNQPQQIIGIACRQPDDHWLFVDTAPVAVSRFGPVGNLNGNASDSAAEAGAPPVTFGLQSPFGYRDWLRAAPQRKPKSARPYGQNNQNKQYGQSSQSGQSGQSDRYGAKPQAPRKYSPP